MERNDEQQIDSSKDVMHRADRRDDDAHRIAVHSLKSMCLLFRPATISLSSMWKIGQGPIFSPTLYAHLTSGFMISPTVGTSSPNKPAIVFRTISSSFIQSGVCPNKAKKISTIPSSGCAS